MKSLYRNLLLFTVGLFFSAISHAEPITGITLNADADYLTVNWSPVDNDTLNKIDGYAIQWSDRQSNVQITKHANRYEGRATGLSLRRASFEHDRYYYLRVYTYTVNENNYRLLGNGSKMIKWKVNFQNVVTKEEISVTDPVITFSSGGTSSTNGDDFEFGTLRTVSYDNFADFSWSRPNKMTSSDFDGFMVVISNKSDLADPIVEAKTTSRSQYVMRVKGLEPNTQYYAKGYFYKTSGGEDRKFGTSSIKSFKTIAAVPRDGTTRASRNLERIEKKSVYTLNIGDSSSSSSTTTTTTTETGAGIDTNDKTAIRKKISELKAQINKLQSELRRWESKLGIKSSTTTTRTTTTKKSNSGLSIKERLRQRLLQKMNRQS